MKRSVLTLFSLVLLCCYTSLSAQNLSCNDQVNISLDENCGILDLSIDAFLEGDDVDETLYTLEILGINDIPVELVNENDPNYIGTYVGQCLTYNVILNANGNSCWGTVCLEDKILPSVECDCESAFLPDGTPDPNCTFNCFEVWDLLELEAPGRNNEVLPDFPNATDNCGDISPSDVQLVFTPGPNCGDEIVTRNILYTFTDFNGNVQNVSCSQEFLFQGLSTASVGETVNGAWDAYPDIFVANTADRPLFDFYTPEHTVELPCGSGTSPADIAAIFDIDTPGRPAGVDRDDHVQTPTIIEHNEGIPYAYPYVVTAGWAGRFHPKPIDNNICNIYAVYEDQVTEACASECFGNSKTARTWSILDWCNAVTITYVQVIKTVDVNGPEVNGPNYEVSVDPWACEAEYTVPAPEHLFDDCDKEAFWDYSVPVGIPNSDGVATLPLGVTPITYNAYDCCGNVSNFTFFVTVVDNTAPTVITKENLVVTLTNTQFGDGIAKLFAADVDNFSHDGCTDVHFEIRRAGTNDWCNPGSNSTFNNDGHPYDSVDDTDNGEFVLFCCEDALEIDDDGHSFGFHDVVLRVWDDADNDGVFGSAGDNYNESWTSVRVEDKLDPIVVCPPHIELSCHEDFLDYDLTGRPFATQACNDVPCDTDPSDNFRTKSANQPPFVGEEILAYNPSCRRGAIQRTWNCGGKTCTQWIIMRDTEDGDLEIIWPEDETVDCIEPTGNEPEVVERLCELTGTSLESDTFYFEDGACFTILNHWSVINWCDYDADDTDLNDQTDPEDDNFIPGLYTHTQTIKLIDTERPVLAVSDTCFAVNADCVGDNIAIWAAAADNGACASDWLKWNVEVDMNSDWEIDYTFSSFLAPDDDFYVAPTGGSAAVPIAYDETVVLNNTIQSDAATNGEEIPVEELFGVPANTFAQAAIIRDKVEYIGYLNGLYDIDLDPNCITFDLVALADDPLYGPLFRVLEEGTVDRYYFEFPEGHNISGGTSSNSSVNFEILSPTEFVIEIGEGFNFFPGESFKIDLESVGESVHIELPNGLPNGCSSSHRVRWTVLDGCGNETSGTSFFTIEDKKKPTPYMINLGSALMEDGSVELWASDFNIGSFDNCSPEDFLYYTFSSNVPPQLLDPTEEDPWYDDDGVASQSDYNNGNAEQWNGAIGSSSMVFNQDDLVTQEEKGGLLPVPVYVWDICGNFDLAIVSLKLVDNGGDAFANIGGRVASEDGQGIPGVTMSATSDQAGYPTSTVTGNNGEYLFAFNPMYNDYMISGAKNDDWLNGVTTLDLVLIQQHILGLNELDSEFKMIAADASNDDNISAVDLIQLRKLILGLFAELPNNNSWTLLNSSMDDGSMVSDLESDMLNQDFTAIKIGDVNGSAVASLLGESTDVRSNNALKLNLDETKAGNNQVYTISAENFNEVYGFQFTLEGISEVISIEGNGLTIDDSNISVVNGALAMSWNSATAITTSQNEALFTITVETLANAAISDRLVRAEAYVGADLETLNIELNGNASQVENALGQNEPNPFKGQTNVGFSLANAGAATFTVFDLTGKVVYSMTDNYQAGNHTITLDQRDLVGTANVLYYKIDSGDFTATKKMIILE